VTEDFEQQLRKALEREEAPPWLAARVIAAANREPLHRRWWQLHSRWAPIALAGIVLFTGLVWEAGYVRRQRAEAEQAKQRLELALTITGAKLRKIQQVIVDQTGSESRR
jgi:hypothetical protein